MSEPVRRLLAVLIGLRGLGNLVKRFGTGSGLVVFGRLLPPDTLLAPLLGLVMLALAYGLWLARGWALPLAVAYALFASVNLFLFPSVSGLPPGITMPMYVAYVVAGLALCWGAVWAARAR